MKKLWIFFWYQNLRNLEEKKSEAIGLGSFKKGLLVPSSPAPKQDILKIMTSVVDFHWWYQNFVVEQNKSSARGACVC